MFNVNKCYFDNFSKGVSTIHGIGIIANKQLVKDQTIGIGIYFFLGYPIVTNNFGSLINHSFTPNSQLIWKNLRWHVVAYDTINQGEEITVNYNNTPFYIENAKSHYK